MTIDRRNWTGIEATVPAGDASGVRDVLLERVRQVDELGYTPEHDMQHTPGSLLAYGHAMIFPPGVPFDPAGYEPSRAELVRAAACALAAIARYDADNTTNTDQEEAHE